MHEKTVLIAGGPALDAQRARSLFSHMDVEVRMLKVPLAKAVGERATMDVDLLVIDATVGQADLVFIESAVAAGGNTAVLALVDETRFASLALPTRLPNDFASSRATDDELKLRCRRLLWPGEMTDDSDFLNLGQLTINMATYQVKVSGEPVDLTYMEYELLSFLATHPGRIYSREVLLSQVWGFDYYGGTRTVDVHVRRLRAKLGPEVAQHIETVRGAGYLWVN